MLPQVVRGAGKRHRQGLVWRRSRRCRAYGPLSACSLANRAASPAATAVRIASSTHICLRRHSLCRSYLTTSGSGRRVTGLPCICNGYGRGRQAGRTAVRASAAGRARREEGRSGQQLQRQRGCGCGGLGAQSGPHAACLVSISSHHTETAPYIPCSTAQAKICNKSRAKSHLQPQLEAQHARRVLRAYKPNVRLPGCALSTAEQVHCLNGFRAVAAREGLEAECELSGTYCKGRFESSNTDASVRAGGSRAAGFANGTAGCTAGSSPTACRQHKCELTHVRAAMTRASSRSLLASSS